MAHPNATCANPEWARPGFWWNQAVQWASLGDFKSLNEAAEEDEDDSDGEASIEEGLHDLGQHPTHGYSPAHFAMGIVPEERLAEFDIKPEKGRANRKGNRAKILKLLSDVSKEKIPRLEDEDGHMPIHYCGLFKVEEEVIAFLCDLGFGNMPDQEGNTALCLAARVGNTDGIKKLLKHGCDANISGPGGLKPLHFAVHKGNTYSVGALLDSADVNVDAVDKYNMTPLNLGVAKCCDDPVLNSRFTILEMLVTRGASLDIADQTGVTPRLRGNRLQRISSLLMKIEKKGKRDAGYKMCNICQIMLSKDSFHFAEWMQTEDAVCKACLKKRESDNKLQQLYLDIDIQDIPDIIVTREQVILLPMIEELAKKKKKTPPPYRRALRSESAVYPLVDFFIGKDVMTQSQATEILRKNKIPHQKQSWNKIMRIYTENAYSKAVGTVDPRLCVKEIMDPQHPTVRLAPPSYKKPHYGCFVKPGEMISKGDIIGEYVGEVIDSVSLFEASIKNGTNDGDSINLSDQEYLMRMDKTTKWLKKSKEGEPNCLNVNALKYRNEMALINDCRGFVPEKRQNVTFVIEDVDGWIHLFVTATQDTYGGEELLGDYGETYWHHQQRLRLEEEEAKKASDAAMLSGYNKSGKEVFRILNLYKKKYEGVKIAAAAINDICSAVKRQHPDVKHSESAATEATIVDSTTKPQDSETVLSCWKNAKRQRVDVAQPDTNEEIYCPCCLYPVKGPLGDHMQGCSNDAWE
eukprot:m.119029 g.119029  ORF g.119029 m.119029 type:complete len:748 (+) comp14300_c0_seq4:91-2334(+)